MGNLVVATDAGRAVLSADDLGEVGEALFRSLCARARLTCNTSERDRTGWDFIVENKPAADGILDTRQRLSCHPPKHLADLCNRIFGRVYKRTQMSTIGSLVDLD